MPRIVLLQPFIRHYAGSVFDLQAATGISGWDEDERVREKQSYHDRRHYILPDDGRGRQVELPVSYTESCPDNVFDKTDIKSGPCRITSVTEGLNVNQNDPAYASPFPLGMGLLRLGNSLHYAKNIIHADLVGFSVIPDKLVIRNRFDHQISALYYDFSNHITVDLSELSPGFYQGDFFLNMQLLHSFTMLKCFPLVLAYDRDTRKYQPENTLW
ncbi:MAG: hypothetical protein IPM26_07915 [Saprospiraceae bacterium]|nr:hypothetical protein [Saprospiraceae bacterium]